MKNGGVGKSNYTKGKRIEHDHVRFPFIVNIPQPDGSIKRKYFSCKQAADAYLKRLTNK